MSHGNCANRSRLIKKNAAGYLYIEGVDISTLTPELYGVVWKLKDYEESGLLPNEVANLEDLYNDACETVNSLRREIDEMRKKLIELPIRPGDTVYDCRDFFNDDIERPRIRKDKVFSVKILEDDPKRTGGKLGVYIYRTECATYRREDFGKTVFLDEKKAHLCAEKKARERDERDV